MSNPFLVRLRGTADGIVDLAGNEWENIGGVTTNNTQLVNGGHAMSFVFGSYLKTGANSKLTILENQDFTISVHANTASDALAYPLLFGARTISIGYGGDYGQRFYSNYNSAYPGYEPHRYGYGDIVSSSIAIQRNVPVHLALVRKNNIMSIYVNGVCGGTKECNEEQIFGLRDCMIGYGGMEPNLIGFSGYIDDVCLLNVAVWDSDFTPPTGYLSLNNVIYITGQEAWGIDSNGDFAKLNNNYSAMTSAEKIAMFEATNRQVPTTSQLKTLTMPIKAVSYYNKNTQPTCTVIAIPESQTIIQKDRINFIRYNKITSISITDTTSGNGIIKLAVTKDNTTYQVYDTTNLEWKTIDIADISTDGMSVSDIESLTSAEWASLDCMDTGLGFAYYLEMQNTTDSASIADISINVEVMGPLKSLVKGTDYDYEYVGIDVLQVKLYKNGDFRINYNPG